jgi:hypothetical protein
MALQSSGPISLNNVNVELGLAGTTLVNMNQSNLRTLFKKTTALSTISMSDGYGKARMPTTMQILVVAGGGGSSGGGGGGGGVLPWFTLTPTQGTLYAITVGAGGAFAANGGNSQFTSTYIAIGGGGGGNGQGAAGATGGSGGGSANPGRGSSGTPGNGYTTPTYGVVQGFRGGYGRDTGNYPYLAGGGGGKSASGFDGSTQSGVGSGYTLDAEIITVPPFSSIVPVWNTVTTTVSSGGGQVGYYNSNGGTGAGGPSYSTAAQMYGCGGYGGGVGKIGIVVVKYPGTQSGTGGNNITYVSASDTTYHVFTSAGNFGFL